MSVTAGKKLDIKYIIHVVIVLFFMFGFGYLPPIDPLSAMGMKALGIFISLVWAWSFVDLVWPSIMAIIAVGLSGFTTVPGAFSSAFGNGVFLLILFCFFIGEYMNQTGLSGYIARFCISRKFLIGRPYLFMFLFCIAMFLISAFVNAMVTIVVGWAIAYEISETVGFKRGDKYPSLLVFETIGIGCMGGWVFPFMTMPAIGLGATQQVTGLPYNALSFVLLTMICALIITALFVLVCKYVFKPDCGNLGLKNDYFEEYRKESLTTEQKIAIGTIAVALFLILAPNFLPKEWLIVQLGAQLSPTGIFAAALMILGLLHWNGKPLIDISTIAKEGSNWKMLIMIAGSMPIGSMMQAPDSGLSELFAQIFSGLASGLGPVMLTVVLMLVCGLLTQVAHNLVIIMVVAPILANVCVGLGVNPYPIIILVICAANTGFITPGGSVAGAMLYSNREWMTAKEVFVYGCATLALIFAVLIVVGIPLASVLFGFTL